MKIITRDAVIVSVMAGGFGLLLSVCGLFLDDWRFWVLLAGYCIGANCQPRGAFE